MEKDPCKPKTEGGADAAPECTTTCRGGGCGCNRSTEQQHGLKNCYVRLEQLPVGDLSSCYCELTYSQTRRRPTPVHCGLEDSRVRDVSVVIPVHVTSKVV
ncbi:hypothetical protein MSG28_014768 [Choristoneura fumiferana]|uniref:Uncharacterized protein n=1 Tax=Choristoneura fumiferana TaxID=7141 RepID=A0ACC0JSK4_CHOFU|nr:hypothetical protein MSG28_014768 [Choristoneura fumiferana]